MPQLPIYTRNSHINTSPIVQRRSSGLAESSTGAAQTGQDLAVKWQETKNAAEQNDAEYRLNGRINNLLQDVQNYNSYQTAKDIENEQKKTLQAFDDLLPQLDGEFSTDSNRTDFMRDKRGVIEQAKLRAEGMYRQKFIDNDAAVARLREQTTMQNYINSGDKAYQQDFLAFTERRQAAGFIDQRDLVAAKERLKDWDKAYYMSQAQINPDGLLQSLKEGKIKTDTDTIDALEKAINKQQKLNDLQTKIANYEITRDVMSKIDENDIQGSLKLLDQNKEALGDKLYKATRKSILSANGITAETQADTAAAILMDIEALTTDPDQIREYYKGTNDILTKINDTYSNGLLSSTDYKRLQNSVYKKQGKNIELLKENDEGDNFFWIDFTLKNANNYIEDNYTNGKDKNKLLIDYFRRINDENITSASQRRNLLQSMINERMNNNFEQAARLPKVGDVVGGYRFKGGNVNDQNNWELVE